ncbi:MAG: zinc-binding dehydrogenase, partial [Microthrixaceae bacterium]
MSTCEALVYEDSPTRFAMARLASTIKPGAGADTGPLRHRPEHRLEEISGPGWVSVEPLLAGICGSDLSALDGRSSRWFEPIVSLPFVPGHEVFATHDGNRVVLEPVLGCVARGITPVCPACAGGDLGRCERLAHGHIQPGLQSGFCESTGGGWAGAMSAHVSQLHVVPDDISDEAAVMVEPTACALHGVLAAEISRGEDVAVIGAGTMGLATVAAIARHSAPRHLVVAARHPHQRHLAETLSGALPASVVGDDALLRAVRRVTGTMIVGSGARQRCTGGVDVTIDCAGTAASLTQALAVTRPGGRVVMVGMPGVATVDMTPLWQREISLRGAYTYGTEHIAGQRYRTFDLAMELVAAARLGDLVS